jgi:hypothetical protein
LLEKAFAKLHGSYFALEAGTAKEALGVLTGLPTEVSLSQLCYCSDICVRQDISEIHIRDGEKSIADDMLFAKIASWHQAGFMLCAACGHTQVPVEQYKRMGLNHAHAYGILSVQPVGPGPQNMLIKLRNPWGSGEWKGPWSDAAKEWTPQARKLCNHNGQKEDRDDGIFWMCLRDVRAFFHNVTVCRVRRMFHQLRWPIKLPNLSGAVCQAYTIECNSRTEAEISLMQATERGKWPEGHYLPADMMVLFLRMPTKLTAGVLSADVVKAGTVMHGSSSGHDDLRSVVATETTMDPGQQYVAVPWGFNTRSVGREHDCTMIMYSSSALKIQKIDVPMDAIAAALRLYLKANGETKGESKDCQVYSLDGCYLVENFHASRFVTFTLEVASSALVASRYKRPLDSISKTPPTSGQPDTAKIQDTIPPSSWQVTNWWSPVCGSWSFNCTSSWTFGGVQVEHHDPELAGDAVHAVYPA